MSAILSHEQQRVIASATTALTRRTEAAISLIDVVALSDDQRRNLILRATALSNDAPPRSVIIKATRAKDYDATSVDSFERSGLVKEWVATTFLTDHVGDKSHSAAFLAGDASEGLIVLEDLGAGFDSLVTPLLEGTASAAEQALTAYAASLGRLHADTLDCARGHTRMLHRAFPASRAAPPVGGESWRRQVVDKVLGLLGGSLPEEEIAMVARHMASPGAWLGLAHRDACPDNVLLVDGRARLLDFEFAGPGHVLLDAAYWRLGFPTCWCAGRVPDSVIAAMDRAYRQALAVGLPAAQDESIFAAEMALMLFARLFASLAWQLDSALKEDERWGISTRRARVLWHLEAAVAGAATIQGLVGLRDAAARWRADLGARWPTAKPLALSPAFTCQPAATSPTTRTRTRTEFPGR